MGFKKWGKEISFADLAVSKALEHDRSLKMMMSIEKREGCEVEGCRGAVAGAL